MAQTIDISKLGGFLASIGSATARASYEAIARTAMNSATLAKQIAVRNFPGRRGYTAGQGLVPSINYRFEGEGYGTRVSKSGKTATTGSSFTAYVGTYGIPYGAIHEFGGKIEPKDAKYLWMRLPPTTLKGSPFRRLTPTDFYKNAKKRGSGFFYMTSRRGNLLAMLGDKEKKTMLPLFWLRDEVTIPARPYLRPAVKAEMAKYPSLYMSILTKGRP